MVDVMVGNILYRKTHFLYLRQWPRTYDCGTLYWKALSITHLALLSWALSTALSPTAAPQPRSPPGCIHLSICLHSLLDSTGPSSPSGSGIWDGRRIFKGSFFSRLAILAWKSECFRICGSKRAMLGRYNVLNIMQYLSGLGALLFGNCAIAVSISARVYSESMACTVSYPRWEAHNLLKIQ